MESKGNRNLQEAGEVGSYATRYYHMFNLSTAEEEVEGKLFDPSILVSLLELVQACGLGVLFYRFTLI